MRCVCIRYLYAPLPLYVYIYMCVYVYVYVYMYRVHMYYIYTYLYIYIRTIAPLLALYLLGKLAWLVHLADAVIRSCPLRLRGEATTLAAASGIIQCAIPYTAIV